MADNKNHHFVPQFYLRNFGSGAGGSVALYNLKSRKHTPAASIRGQCQRPWLYGRELAVEKDLGELEGRASGVIARIIATGEPPSTNEDFVHLIAFIAFQWGRTPAAGEAMNAVATKTFRAILKASTLPEGIRDHVDAVRVEHELPAVLSLKMTGSLGPVLLDLEQRVLVNRTSAGFLTSDSPVVLFNQWCRGARDVGTTGMAASGLQIFLPLSPDHVLLLFDRDIYGISDKGERFVDVTSDRNVLGINALQLLTAEHNLFYSGRPTIARAIDGLPLRWISRRGNRVGMHRALDAAGKSQLLHLYQQGHDVSLDLSFLRILRRKRGIPLPDRINKYRAMALAADTVVRGDREPREAPTGRGPWSVIESD